MTEKQIIERLILDICCILESSSEVTAREREMYDQLVVSGKYKVYPSYYKQTEEQKEEIRQLINYKIDDNK